MNYLPRTESATLNIWGFPMVCVFEYQAGEDQTRHNPGTPDQAILQSCRVGGFDVMDMVERDPATVERIEEEYLEKRERILKDDFCPTADQEEMVAA